MTNHFHLLFSSDLPNEASLLMKFLGHRYVQYVSGIYAQAVSIRTREIGQATGQRYATVSRIVARQIRARIWT